MMRHNPGGDPYFDIGMAALCADITAITGTPLSLRGLYFPDMRSLLLWSMKPVLPEEGLLLIAGSHAVITTLKGLLDPRYVLFLEKGETLTSLRDRLIKRVCTGIPVQEAGKGEIRFTAREMSYMWAFIQGITRQSESKRDSGIRRVVMDKIGASGLVSLLIRFRLLFYLDSRFLLRQVRMRGGRLRGTLSFPEPVVIMGDEERYRAAFIRVKQERVF